MDISKQAVSKLKGVAIAAVFLIHFTTDWHSFSSNTIWDFLWFCLNQLLRFCVPLFVALSGYALTFKYKDTNPNLPKFILDRAKKLLPIFFAWAVFLLLLGFVIPELRSWNSDLSMWRMLFGIVDYHLYFVPMIFQLYLVFPMLLKYTKSHPVSILVASFVIQSLAIYATEQLILNTNAGSTWWTDQQQYVWSFFWVFYFVLGMVLAKHKINERRVSLLLTLTVLSSLWAISDAFLLWKSGQNIIIATRFTRLSILSFASFSTLFFFYIPVIKISIPKSINKFVLYIGNSSYIIYLTHTFFLRVIDKVFT